MKAVVFSHRRHLQRTVSKLYAVKAEGFLNALKAEVNLMTDMVFCLRLLLAICKPIFCFNNTLPVLH